MEGFHGSSSSIGNFSKAPKIKLPPGMKTQPLMIGSSFDSYSENLDLNAPLIRYLCAGSPVAGKRAVAGDGGGFVPRGSPLSAMENLIDRSPAAPPPSPAPLVVYGTPVKAVEGEEVLVIDGVAVKGGRKRIPWFCGSDSSSASGSSGKSLFKTDNCRSSLEDSGNCRYSSKCQFAHGREDLRPIHLSIKSKSESQLSRSYNSPGRTYSPNSRFLPQVIGPILAEAAVTPTRTASTIVSRTPAKTASPTTSMTPIKIPSPTILMTQVKIPSPTTSGNTQNKLSTAMAWKEWSPQDDRIEVALPFSSTGKQPSRESVNAYINEVLSGRSTRRLPVFTDICPE